MFCKILQTFSTQNLAGQLLLLQSLTNSVENFFRTFSTAAQRPLRNAPCAQAAAAANLRCAHPSQPVGWAPPVYEATGGYGFQGVCRRSLVNNYYICEYEDIDYQ